MSFAKYVDNNIQDDPLDVFTKERFYHELLFVFDINDRHR